MTTTSPSPDIDKIVEVVDDSAALAVVPLKQLDQQPVTATEIPAESSNQDEAEAASLTLDSIQEIAAVSLVAPTASVQRALTVPIGPTVMPSRYSVGPFEVSDKGVYYNDAHADPEKGPTQIRVCSRLDIIALTRDTRSESWGSLLKFQDKDLKTKEWAMPSEMLKGEGADYRGCLLSMGLEVSPGSKARLLLAEYLQRCQPLARATCVDKTGWQPNGAYVFPDESIGGPSDELMIFQTDDPTEYGMLASRTLEEWKEHVGQPAVGNSRIAFSISLAFASCLLHHTGEQSGGFHLRGGTSTGKSTATKLATSVWGNPSTDGESWRATGNALEGTAEKHNDALLVLDEIDEVNPQEVGSIAYMLGNGTGKGRAHRNGNAKQRRRWRLLFLSTGEISLDQHMASAGKKVRGGQEVRMADIPADAGRAMGIFEDIHGAESPDLFAKQIDEAARTYYGTAIREFIRLLTNA